MKKYSNTKLSRGFTLIEAVIYMALFTILIGGAVVSSYSVFESLGRNQVKAVLQEEGNFLIGKINWELSGVASVDLPTANSSGPTLSVTKWDPEPVNPLTLALVGGSAMLTRGTNPALAVTNSDITVTNLQFQHDYPGGTNPENVKSSFTLTIRTPNGQLISENFSNTNYLRH